VRLVGDVERHHQRPHGLAVHGDRSHVRAHPPVAERQVEVRALAGQRAGDRLAEPAHLPGVGAGGAELAALELRGVRSGGVEHRPRGQRVAKIAVKEREARVGHALGKQPVQVLRAAQAVLGLDPRSDVLQAALPPNRQSAVVAHHRLDVPHPDALTGLRDHPVLALPVVVVTAQERVVQGDNARAVVRVQHRLPPLLGQPPLLGVARQLMDPRRDPTQPLLLLRGIFARLQVRNKRQGLDQHSETIPERGWMRSILGSLTRPHANGCEQPV
jgi:hypothetical protein